MSISEIERMGIEEECQQVWDSMRQLGGTFWHELPDAMTELAMGCYRAGALTGKSRMGVTDDPVEREKLFQRWWKASKYCQVIYPEPHLEQYARDGFEAGIEALTQSTPAYPEPITDARLAEMVGADVPCVPAQPGEIAAVVQELRKARDLMRKAHAVMRECGWQLAASAEPSGDGVLELACSEIEADFAEALKGASNE